METTCLDAVDSAELDVETSVGVNVGVTLHTRATAPGPRRRPCDVGTAGRRNRSAGRARVSIGLAPLVEIKSVCPGVDTVILTLKAVSNHVIHNIPSYVPQ